MPFPIAAALGALGSVVSGIGASKDRRSQKQVAQNSIQWRVADAKAAGVHPLYALGAPTMSFSPVGDGGAGAGLSQMGQDISRARAAQMDRNERNKEWMAGAVDRQMQRRSNELQLQNMELQNSLLASRIANVNQPGTPPGIPQDQLSDGGRFQPSPASPTISASDNPAREAGHITDFGYVRQNDGGIGIMPSRDAKDRTEDSLIEETLWGIRNRVAPALSGLRAPSLSQYPLPPNHVWRWDPVRQAFYPFNTVRRVPVRRGGSW